MMPSMDCRCMNTNTATTGTVASVAPARMYGRARKMRKAGAANGKMRTKEVLIQPNVCVSL